MEENHPKLFSGCFRQYSKNMHFYPKLDGIGASGYAELEQLNDPRVKVTLSKRVQTKRR